MLHQLAEQAAIVRRAYAEFDYKTVVASLSAFMNTELSAFYFDIRKDTLYCDPPSSLARKAALTTIDIILDAILRWFAPVLSFTSEEAWQLYKPDAEPSVHLTFFPEGLEGFRDEKLAVKWETIRNVRRVVTGALEVERAAKRIGSSLEASPLVYVSDQKIFDTLFDIDLAEVSITSNAMVTNDDAPAGAFRLNDVPGVAVVVEKAEGTKCARSWKILPTVGDDPEYPDVSPRDAQALREWKTLGGGEEPVGGVEEPAKPVEPIEKQPIEQNSPGKEASEETDLRKVTARRNSRKASAGTAKGAAKAKSVGKAKSAGRARNARKAKKARKARNARKTKAAAKRKIGGKARKAVHPTKVAKKKAGKKVTKKKAAKKPGKSKQARATKKTKKKKAR